MESMVINPSDGDREPERCMSAAKQNGDRKLSGYQQPTGRRQPLPPRPPEAGRNFQGWPPQEWGSMLWYFLLMLGMLWFWQEASHQLTTRTIPYSQFKDLAAQRRVADLTINETEITGKVLPTPAPAGQSHRAISAVTNSLAESESKAAEATNASTHTGRASATNAVAGSSAAGEEKASARLHVSHGSGGRPGPGSRPAEGGGRVHRRSPRFHVAVPLGLGDPDCRDGVAMAVSLPGGWATSDRAS